MKRIWILATFLLAVSLSASALDCKSAINDVREAWDTHWKAKQLDEVMGLYAEDATLLSADGHLQVGRAQIQAYLQELMDSGTAVSVQSAGPVCSPDSGIDTGTYSESISKGGRTIGRGNARMGGNAKVGGGGTTRHGNYSVVLRQDSETWQIVHQAFVRSE